MPYTKAGDSTHKLSFLSPIIHLFFIKHRAKIGIAFEFANKVLVFTTLDLLVAVCKSS